MLPLIIGLPGAGKTYLARALSLDLGVNLLETDKVFREFRKIPSTADTLNVVVMKKFLRRIEVEYPKNTYEAISKDARTVDNDGQCVLLNSAKFRSYGEKIFRLFEIEMLRHLHETGRFNDAIPDLSASALLYKENRRIFNKKNGYFIVLLDTDHEEICQNLVKDYEVSIEKKKTIRGAYEKKFTDALEEEGPFIDENEKRNFCLNIASMLTVEAQEKRMPIYKEIAALTYTPSRKESSRTSVKNISAIISQYENRR